MDISSIPAAPLLAFTRFHARSMFSRERICSSRSVCAPPCFPSDASSNSARPFGVHAACCGSEVEAHLTGSGLPPQACGVLFLLLTSRSDCPVGISPDKNANSSCTTSAFCA